MTTPRSWLFAVLVLLTATASAAESFVYFGSHSSGPGVGFSLARFDSDTGVLTRPEFLLEAKEPAFFVVHPDGRHLYACNSGAPGGLSAYTIEPGTGKLTLINRVLTGGGDASYVSLDQTGRYAFVANYNGGNIAAFSLRADGGIGDWTAFVQHRGRSVHPERQTRPYAHAIVIDATNRWVLVPDLGVDKLFVYRFDAATGSLTPHNPPAADIAPGSGPRHVRFHPNGRWVYLINELASTITVFDWNAADGALTERQTTSTLPAEFKGHSTCAEIEIHPNGRFVYGSNRGHDSLAVFAIDEASGHLTALEHVPSGGQTPRNFAFDPTSRWIVCTNQNSNNAVVFRVDATTGRLTRTGEPVPVPAPFCERFLPIR
ncbi:MAG TPA: lactonase family protein [Opitutus sp.]|nr:lactonase family protein [Opitutus sp.]